MLSPLTQQLTKLKKPILRYQKDKLHTLSSAGKVEQWERSQVGRINWSQLFKRNCQDLEGPAQHRLVSVQQVPTKGSVYCLAV